MACPHWFTRPMLDACFETNVRGLNFEVQEHQSLGGDAPAIRCEKQRVASGETSGRTRGAD
jgi:hypothetical protein